MSAHDDDAGMAGDTMAEISLLEEKLVVAKSQFTDSMSGQERHRVNAEVEDIERQIDELKGETAEPEERYDSPTERTEVPEGTPPPQMPPGVPLLPQMELQGMQLGRIPGTDIKVLEITVELNIPLDREAALALSNALRPDGIVIPEPGGNGGGH